MGAWPVSVYNGLPFGGHDTPKGAPIPFLFSCLFPSLTRQTLPTSGPPTRASALHRVVSEEKGETMDKDTGMGLLALEIMLPIIGMLIWGVL